MNIAEHAPAERSPSRLDASSSGPALLGWVKDDAEFVAERIDAFEEAPTAADEARQNDDVGAPQQGRLAQKA